MFRMSRKDRRIANQKAMINNRDILIGDLQAENQILKEENKKGNEAITILEEVYKLTTCNKYNNEESVFNKIKELVDDHQSIN